MSAKNDYKLKLELENPKIKMASILDTHHAQSTGNHKLQGV